MIKTGDNTTISRSNITTELNRLTTIAADSGSWIIVGTAGVIGNLVVMSMKDFD